MTTHLNQSLGRYHILEQLGQGGMATVYKAFDTRLEREVAVKFIRSEKLSGKNAETVLKRFKREAQALAKLSHPNILTVLDYGEHEGQLFLVTEYLPGGSLKQKLGKPMHWAEAAKLLAPIARSLEYAHSQRVLHRDIKPANILLSPSGLPVLADFGIAKLLEGEETTELTRADVGIGTPDYMAPEQGRGKADARSDIYSLGVVFYEMVTGRRPYSADTPLAVLLMHATDPLPRPKAFIRDLPDDIEKLIFKALAKKAEDRYQSMAEFAAALDKLAQGHKVSVGKVVRATGKTPRRSLAQAGLLAGSILLVVSTIIAGLALTYRTGQPIVVTIATEITATPWVIRVTATPVPVAAIPVTPTATPTTGPTPKVVLLCQEDMICISDADGKNLIRLAKGHWPQWSPDGTEVVYYGPPGTVGDRLFVMDVATHKTVGLGSGWCPAWSPDGKSIAFGWGDGVYVMDADGGGRRQMVGGSFPESKCSLVWSPDSKQIALSADNRAEIGKVVRQIAVVNAVDGKVIFAYTDEVRERFVGDFYLAWSADGSLLAYYDPADGQTYMIKPDGSGEPQVTYAAVRSWYPTYWPQWDLKPPAPNPTPMVLFYDNFDDRVFDGIFNTRLWNRQECDEGICSVGQEDSVIRFRVPTDAKGSSELRSAPAWQMTEIGYVQGQFKLSEFIVPPWGGNLHLSIGAQLDSSTWWSTQCVFRKTSETSTQPVFSCDTYRWTGESQQEYATDLIPVDPDRWYEVRIELDASTSEIRFFLDGQFLGSHVPEDASTLQKKYLRITVGTWSDGDTRIVGYADGIVVGPAP